MREGLHLVYPIRSVIEAETLVLDAYRTHEADA